MHWERLKPPPNFVSWVLVLVALVLLSLAAFTITLTVGLGTTGVLAFGLAFLTRSDEKPVSR